MKYEDQIMFVFERVCNCFFCCDAQENGPKIELPNSIDYTYVIVADSIDIPWD